MCQPPVEGGRTPGGTTVGRHTEHNMSGTTGATERQATNRATPKRIAHRGFAGVYPENTLAAFEQAMRDSGP
ncbi:hypothetical protein BRD15_10955, partial [Halobacteriales archaeon SW_6_65_15]